MSEKENNAVIVQDEAAKPEVLLEENEPVRKKGKETHEKAKKMRFFAIGVLVLALAAAAGVIAFRYATNNYKTPIKTIEKYENAKEYTWLERTIDFNGGLAKKEIRQLFKVLRNSDHFLELEESVYDESIEAYKRRLDRCGEDFVITCTVVECEELTKADLRNVRAFYRERVKEIEDVVDETEEYTLSDWRMLSEDLGLMTAETKELFEVIKSITDQYGRIEVSEGYAVTVLVTTTGCELDEPADGYTVFEVCKVNGKWVRDSYSFGFGAALTVIERAVLREMR